MERCLGRDVIHVRVENRFEISALAGHRRILPERAPRPSRKRSKRSQTPNCILYGLGVASRIVMADDQPPLNRSAADAAAELIRGRSSTAGSGPAQRLTEEGLARDLGSAGRLCARRCACCRPRATSSGAVSGLDGPRPTTRRSRRHLPASGAARRATRARRAAERITARRRRPRSARAACASRPRRRDRRQRRPDRRGEPLLPHHDPRGGRQPAAARHGAGR